MDLNLEYQKVANRAIKLGLITEKEWENRFSKYRDYAGHSFVHYLECIIANLDVFLTINPIMIDNRKELQERFGVKIMNLEEIKKEVGCDHDI